MMTSAQRKIEIKVQADAMRDEIMDKIRAGMRKSVANLLNRIEGSDDIKRTLAEIRKEYGIEL